MESLSGESVPSVRCNLVNVCLLYITIGENTNLVTRIVCYYALESGNKLRQ